MTIDNEKHLIVYVEPKDLGTATERLELNYYDVSHSPNHLPLPDTFELSYDHGDDATQVKLTVFPYDHGETNVYNIGGDTWETVQTRTFTPSESGTKVIRVSVYDHVRGVVDANKSVSFSLRILAEPGEGSNASGRSAGITCNVSPAISSSRSERAITRSSSIGTFL